MRVVVAVDGVRGSVIAEALGREGVEVLAVTASVAPAELAADRLPELREAGLAHALADAEVLVLQTDRMSLTGALVGLCDRGGVRIAPLCADAEDEPLAGMFGLMAPLPLDVEPWRIVDALADERMHAQQAEPDAPRAAPRIVVVWGPGGAPGRSTIAVELAVELARGGRRVALVDADTHAPSIALQLGLADEGPGFAAACRQAERGELDAGELTRIGIPLGRSGVDVLAGINRPSRWPELTDARVSAVLEACRGWADYTVVDVAAPLERDEEIVSDLDGPRRNAATLAALRAADLVVAVAAADPVGVSRFLRAHAELRATIGATPVAVVANRLRPGALGIDARGQVRRTLDRFGGVGEVWFVPSDGRSADAALLAARPIAEVAPKSPLTLAIRRLAGEAIAPAPTAASGSEARPRRRRTHRRDARRTVRAA